MGRMLMSGQVNLRKVGTMRMSVAAASVAAMLIAVPAGASTVISTLALENDDIYWWGLPNTAAYGQTFTLAAPASFNEVQFRINDLGEAIDFTGYLFSWSGNSVTGSALGAVNGTTAGQSGMETVTVDFGAVDLLAGEYVAFLQATSVTASLSRWGSVNGMDAYAGGLFVYQNNDGDISQITGPWIPDYQGSGYDLAFAITLDREAPGVIPLPAGLPLLLGALGLLGLAARRRAG